MPLLQEAVLVLGGLLSLLGIVAIVAGGRRWKGNFEAEHVRAERLEATLVEKDKIVTDQADRLGRLESMVQELGGHRVFEVVVAQQQEASQRYSAAMAEVSKLFDKVFRRIDAAEERQRQAIERHEERANERAERMLGLVDTIGHTLAELNGRSRE